MNLAYLKNEHDLFEKVCKFVFKNKPFVEKAWQDMIRTILTMSLRFWKYYFENKCLKKSSFQVSFKDQFY